MLNLGFACLRGSTCCPCIWRSACGQSSNRLKNVPCCASLLGNFAPSLQSHASQSACICFSATNTSSGIMLQASVQVNFCQDACVYLAPRPNAMAESPQNLRAVGLRRQSKDLSSIQVLFFTPLDEWHQAAQNRPHWNGTAQDISEACMRQSCTRLLPRRHDAWQVMCARTNHVPTRHSSASIRTLSCTVFGAISSHSRARQRRTRSLSGVTVDASAAACAGDRWPPCTILISSQVVVATATWRPRLGRWSPQPCRIKARMILGRILRQQKQ